MRIGALFAILVTYLTAFPQSFADAVSMFPPWFRDSLPAWIGPMTLGMLFIARFWNQTHPRDPDHDGH